MNTLPLIKQDLLANTHVVAYVLSGEHNTPIETLWLKKTDKMHNYIVENTPFFTHGLNYADTVVAYQEKKKNRMKLDKYNVPDLSDLLRIQRIKSRGNYMTVWFDTHDIERRDIEILLDEFIDRQKLILSTYNETRIAAAINREIYEEAICLLNDQNFHYTLPFLEFDETF